MTQALAGMEYLPVNRRPISIRHAFSFAWSAYKQRWSVFTAVLLTMVGAWVALELIVIAGQRLGLVWWAVAHMTFFLVFAGLEVGFLCVCLACYQRVQQTEHDAERKVHIVTLRSLT